METTHTHDGHTHTHTNTHAHTHTNTKAVLNRMSRAIGHMESSNNSFFSSMLSISSSTASPKRAQQNT